MNNMYYKIFKKTSLIFLSFLVLIFTQIINACTTIKLQEGNNVLVGRNFDWPNKYGFLVINPIGTFHEEKELTKNNRPLSWSSQYGNVTFDLATKNGKPLTQAVAGGMNQYGLVASILWLSHTQYPEKVEKTDLYSGLWAQYILDNSKTVSDAIRIMSHIQIQPTLFDGKKILVHLMVTDPEGHSAIFEYINGKLHIFTGKNAPIDVLTNTIYPHALEMLQHYKNFGGSEPLPSGYYTRARFVLAANFLRLLPKNVSLQQAIALNFEALGYLIELPGTESPTMWSVVYNLKNKTLYYRDIDNQNIRYLKLDDINFSNKKIDYEPFLINNQLVGNIINAVEQNK